MLTPELRTRVLSGALLAAIALIDVVLGGWFFAAFVAVALVAMAHEWAGLSQPDPRLPALLLPSAVGIAGILALMLERGDVALVVMLLGIPLAGGLVAILRLGSAGRAGAGVLYLCLPCLCLVWLRNEPTDGLGLVVWLLLVVWSTDTMAYFTGRAIGGPKLAPAISPGKTWSGLAGGVAGAALVGMLASRLLPLDRLLLIGLLAALLAAIAQAGDLLESWLKRRAGVKDSGRLIPGHGGALDRLDGLMTAAPAFAGAMALLGMR